MKQLLTAIVCLMSALMACGPSVDAEVGEVTDSSSTGEASLIGTPQQIVGGSVSLLYADSARIIYTSGQQLFVRALTQKTSAKLVDNIGTGVQVVGVGGTIMIWYNINPATGVGALGRYTPGLLNPFAKLSDASMAPAAGNGRTAFAVSTRGTLYTTNVSADGTSADIAYLSSQGLFIDTPVLQAHVNVDQNGSCRPSLGFNGDDALVETCAAGASVATLTAYSSSQMPPKGRVIATNLKPSNAAYSSSFSIANASQYLVFGPNKEPQIVGGASPINLWPAWPHSYAAGQMVSSSSAVILAPDPQTNAPGLFRISNALTAPQVEKIDSLVTVLSNHLPGGYWYGTDKWTTPDGQKLLYATASDPNTGLIDVVAANIGGATITRTRLTTQANCTSSPSLFTADSKNAVFACLNASTGSFRAFAGRLSDGVVRPISADGFTFSNVALGDGRVVVGDNTDANYTINDIKVVTLGSTIQSTTLISGAGSTFFVANATTSSPQLVFVVPQDTATLKAGIYRQAL